MSLANRPTWNPAIAKEVPQSGLVKRARDQRGNMTLHKRPEEWQDPRPQSVLGTHQPDSLMNSSDGNVDLTYDEGLSRADGVESISAMNDSDSEESDLELILEKVKAENEARLTERAKQGNPLIKNLAESKSNISGGSSKPKWYDDAVFSRSKGNGISSHSSTKSAAGSLSSDSKSKAFLKKYVV